MFLLPKWSKTEGYDLSNQEDLDDAGVERRPKAPTHSKFSIYLRVLTTLVCFGVWTYFVGSTSYHGGIRRVAAEYQHQNLDVHMVHHTFHYDNSFSEPPTSNHIHRDYPWVDLYPKHGPYFNKSMDSSERWTFSVFHQLHCVNRLRHGYWRARTAAKGGKPLGDDQHDRMTSPMHIQHCLDYLRQSLMCHGDTTLEPDDPGINGAHGFGPQHNCKSWHQLLEETDKRVLHPHL
ncbi:hypothetical protein VTL71DRAFT_15913 [Oculimacula yallundae]|uniref:Oxidase ustYa n=1 Tax=Oculimacula yallundae TaxID=86028 RepID=A0ABR4CE77_9HELO